MLGPHGELIYSTTRFSELSAEEMAWKYGLGLMMKIGSGADDTEEALPGVCCLLTHPCEQRTPHSSGVVSHECNEDSTAWVYVPRFYGAPKLFFKLRGKRLE